MGLTSITQVRMHLGRLNPGTSEIRNLTFRMEGDDYLYLPQAHVVSGSEGVKALESNSPHMETIILNESVVSLMHQPLVAGTVVVASDSSLALIYQENVDFTVDHPAGTLMRIDGGAIASGSSVAIWYLYYRVYQRGVDYLIDYDRGRIKRLADGAIEAGQEVLIDYDLGETQFTDDEIDQAIGEAEAEIGLLLHPDYRETTDPALQTAATSLAVAILCRNAAAMFMASGGNDRSLQTGWMELAASYRQTAAKLLSWFGREVPALKTPRLG